MKRILVALLFTLTMTVGISAARGQQNSEVSRNRTRELLRALLDKAGPEIKVSFRQSDKQPFNFVGVMKDGLVNSDSIEIVISVSSNETVHFRIFPHYTGAYVNLDKVKNSPGLMRQLLNLSNRTFLYWGADESGDIFTGYTFTLESGFPEEAIKIVLRSIVNMDKYVGEMRPMIDGTNAPSQLSPTSEK
jgi:hypothetical protein